MRPGSYQYGLLRQINGTNIVDCSQVDKQDLASLAMMTLASALKLACESSFYRKCSLSQLKCDAFLRLDQVISSHCDVEFVDL